MQNDFMPWGSLPVAEGDSLIPYINELIEKYPHSIASQDWHPKGHMSFASTHGVEPFSQFKYGGMEQIVWPDHCVQGSVGAEFVDGLHIAECEKIIQKGCDIQVDSYSAFFDNAKKHDSGLHAYCQELSIDTLRVVGVALEYCVQYTVLDALSLGYTVEVDLQGCKGVESSPGDCKKAIAHMKEKGALLVDQIRSLS